MERRLEEAYPGRIRYGIFREPHDVTTLAENAARVSQDTYQWRKRGGFTRTQGTEAFLELAARQDWLRGYLLYVEERPIAFWIGTLYRNSCRLDTTGYLPEFRKHEPGSILFLHMLKDICSQGVQQLDFGFAGAFYKERFGDAKTEDASVCVFAPTLKGIVLMAWRNLEAGTYTAARRIVSRLRLENPLRRIIRGSSARR